MEELKDGCDMSLKLKGAVTYKPQCFSQASSSPIREEVSHHYMGTLTVFISSESLETAVTHAGVQHRASQQRSIYHTMGNLASGRFHQDKGQLKEQHYCSLFSTLHRS